MNRAERRRLAKQQSKSAHRSPLTSGDRINQLFREALENHQAGFLDKARQGYCQILEINPEFADACYNLGTIDLETGALEKAADAFRKCIRIKPDFAASYFNLGFVLSETGQLEEARAAFKNVIKLVPDAADAYRQLTSITKYHDYNDDIRIMEKLHAKPGLTDEQRMNISFGLAKSFEDIKEFSKSFHFLTEANRLRRATYSYSSQQQQLYFKRIRETFSSSFMENFSGPGHNDETPVFILGMPRSGTSLVEQILASHPEVFGAGELPLLSQTARSHFGSAADDNYCQRVHSAGEKQFAEIGRFYTNALREHAQNERFITDKMPHNFLHIGLIKLALPNAKIIHCKRDPVDNCLSMYKTFFPGTVHEYSSDLTETGEYYALYSELIEYWHTTLPGFIYDIQYEDLVNDQEAQTRALLSHCDLDWDDACLEFHKTRRVVQTASMAQVRNPIYNSSVQLWKQYEKELEPLIKVLHNQDWAP